LQELADGEDLIVSWAELGTIGVYLEKEDKGIISQSQARACAQADRAVAPPMVRDVNFIRKWDSRGDFPMGMEEKVSPKEV
jgi:hypothetical protein